MPISMNMRSGKHPKKHCDTLPKDFKIDSFGSLSGSLDDHISSGDLITDKNAEDQLNVEKSNIVELLKLQAEHKEFISEYTKQLDAMKQKLDGLQKPSDDKSVIIKQIEEKQRQIDELVASSIEPPKLIRQDNITKKKDIIKPKNQATKTERWK